MSILEAVLDKLVSDATPVIPDLESEKRAGAALDLTQKLVESFPHLSRGHCLAALFDLLVAEEYYKIASAAGWWACPETQSYYYNYTNICPGCLSSGKFTHRQGKKPSSATIGKVVADTLRTFIAVHIRGLNRDYELLKAYEPMDLVIVSRDEKRIFAGEIKAAPLLTLPLVIRAPTRISAHRQVDLADRNSAMILIPESQPTGELRPFAVFEEGGVWPQLTANLLEAARYVEFWIDALKHYAKAGADAANHSARWLSNGCGAPGLAAAGPHWPGRGSGLESVSDGKTSVGMDRTDDLKKAVYQLLKIGVELREGRSDYKLHTGIISNIHPVRHSEYIYPMLDIVWGHGKRPGTAPSGQGQVPMPQENYFLIDGLIALTEQKIQDPWVKKAFSL